MKFKIALATCAVVASMFIISQPAEAAPYCREYTKKIIVGGRMESGYGRACLQPDGDWMITDARGTVDPFEDFYEQNPNVILVSEQRPVYYNYGYRDRQPVYYYPRSYYRQPSYYRPNNSGVNLFFNFDDDRRYGPRYDNRRRDRDWSHNNHNDRRDRNDRHDNRDNGRGRNRH